MSDGDDPVDEAERALIQIPYLLAQGIETAARVRVMRAERQEHAERAGAESEVRAAADAARQLQAERDQASPVWQRADDRDWVRGAEPSDLFEAWAAATAWQEHDRGAAASAQRAEAEMRRRWPDQMRLYDDARMTRLAAPEAMRNMVTTATNAGWDPTRRAYPQPAAGIRLGLPSAASRDGEVAVPDRGRGGEPPADAERTLSPAERAVSYLPTAPTSPAYVGSTTTHQDRPHLPARPRRR